MSRPVKYFWEDFKLEERVCMGSVSVELGEVVDFAKRFDPQPVQVDADQAKKSIYGDIIACLAYLLDGDAPHVRFLPARLRLAWLSRYRGG